MRIYQLYQDNQMSIQLSFLLIKVQRQSSVQNEQPHKFQLQISSKQFRQSLKTNLHSVDNGWVNLPQNVFVLPLRSVLDIEIEQGGKNSTIFSNDNLHGRHQLDLTQIPKLQFAVSQGIVSFQTDNRQFKIDITYKSAFIKNKIFAGYFNGYLLNQGSRALGLIDMRTQQKHQSPPQRQFQKYAVGTLTTQQQSLNKKSEPSNKKSQKSWRHWIHICNQAKVDQDLSYFQEQSAKGADQNRNIDGNKSKTERKKFKQQNDEKRTTQTEQKQKKQTKQSSELNNKRNKKQEKLSSNVNFYKGSCKDRNIFSCIDSHVDDSEVHIIEPKYR